MSDSLAHSIAKGIFLAKNMLSFNVIENDSPKIYAKGNRTLYIHYMRGANYK